VILRIKPGAEADIQAAANWYAQRGGTLRYEFLDELDACLARIRTAPASSAFVDDDVRRAMLRRFPYAVYYTVDPEEIVILAVIHGRRDPDAWKERA